MSIRALAICVLLLLAPTIAAQAKTKKPDYARTGGYVRGGYQGSVENASDLDFAAAIIVGGTQSTEVSHGFALGGGWKLLPNLAFELAFEYFPDARIQFTSPAIGTQNFANRRVFALTGNVKGYALTGRIQPFALIGLGMANVKYQVLRSVPAFAGATDEGSGLVARFGGGLEYYMTGNNALYLDGSYNVTTGGIGGNDYGSFGAGLMTRF